MLNSTKPNYQLANTLVAAYFSSLRVGLPAGPELLSPVRQWLGRLEVRNVSLAHFICRIVPTQCPFEREICLFGRFAVNIPPLCKLNPLYEEIVSLRFKALCYLADECNEDIRRYG